MPSVEPSIEAKAKPSNATYVAQIDVNPDGQIKLTQAGLSGCSHAFAEVNVAWYGADRIKITLKSAGPAAIRQAFLPGGGKDVILDLVALPRGES